MKDTLAERIEINRQKTSDGYTREELKGFYQRKPSPIKSKIQCDISLTKLTFSRTKRGKIRYKK